MVNIDNLATYDDIVNAKYAYKGCMQGIDGGIVYVYEDENGHIIYETDEV